MERKKIWPFILFGLLVFNAIIFGALLGKGLAETRNTENIENFTDFDTALPTRLLDVNGELITEYASDEKREIIAIKNLPQQMIDALLTREDYVFYHHKGYSLKALFRAVVGVLTHKSLGGGSTLTQQIAGSLYCDRSDYSVKRKLKELWWAVQMERRYSKDEILETYLNKIYFGGGTYGVSAASKYYFGHSAIEITPAEAAILVIQLSNPAFYNPFENPNRAMARQQDVLTSMVNNGYLTKEEAEDSFDDYWANFDFTRTSTSAYAMRQDEAPWFSEYVRRQLSDMLYGTDDIYTGGYTVNTTLNLSHQRAAQNVMTDYLTYANNTYQSTMSSHESKAFQPYIPVSELVSLVFNLPSLKVSGARAESLAVAEYRKKINPIIDVISLMSDMETMKTVIVNKGNALIKQNAEKTTIEGTMIALENSTGYIDAMVGGSKYDSENQFIRAVQSKLQPGSTFKPLYYSAAIDSKNFTMSTIISDTPVVFKKKDGTPYIPQDFKGRWEGDVELWYALATSMNVPSLKVLDGIGFNAAIQRTSSLLGIKQTELQARNFEPVYPLGLGVCAVRPVELAKAFATYANNGKEVTPISIRNVEDKSGNIIMDPEKEQKAKDLAKGKGIQIISPETAFIMQELLKKTVEVGTLQYGTDWDSTYYTLHERKGKGNKLKYYNEKGQSFIMPAAGKTGTTQNWADAWTVGFTPYYTAAFWFGFDKPGQSLGLKITGATLAGVAWGDYMHEINDGLPYKTFGEKPDTLIELEVCSTSGGLYTEECGSHKLVGYYYPGTEPTESCTKHSSQNSNKTLGVYRLQQAKYISGYDFAIEEGNALFVNLDFLNSDSKTTEINEQIEESMYNTSVNEFINSSDPDDFSNWLMD